MATADSSDTEPNILQFGVLDDMMMAYTKSFTLRAIVDLRIPDMLAKSGGQLTLSEIAERLPSKTVNVDYLNRVLIYAAVNGLLTQRSSDSNAGSLLDGERTFGLTKLSRLLLEEESDAPEASLAPTLRFLTASVHVNPWYHLSDAVLSGTQPFELAHGMSLWKYTAKTPEYSELFHKGMVSGSVKFMNSFLKFYKGFEGVKRLVDVGGGLGGSLRSIVQAWPGIKGVNFDLPHVIAQAPDIPGVQHVSGDMFEGVPEGDAIFMKWILHVFGDEECVKVLQSCHKSLPDDGKLIIVDYVLPPPEKGTPMQYMADMRMLLNTPGRERTAFEWKQLLPKAGFPRVEIIPPYDVIEAYKS